MAEASFTGTLRTIALLLIAWWVLRLWLRTRELRTPSPPPRKPGDVRIEDARTGAPIGKRGRIVDADYEEIK
jgi:hypothetical protein